jgi:transcriptional regulator of arginine metabolism
MDKEARHEKIRSLIRARRIGTQQELAERLERAGVAVTQSSVSRDLEEMGVVKRHGRYVLPWAERGMSARGLLSLEAAGECLVVAKCESGLASAVAVEIDNAGLEEVVGTIAGDDTIFVAVREHKQQRAAIKAIWDLFGGEQ